MEIPKEAVKMQCLTKSEQSYQPTSKMSKVQHLNINWRWWITADIPHLVACISAGCTFNKEFLQHIKGN